jgi:nucleoside-diphosphate-sugar epimerase
MLEKGRDGMIYSVGGDIGHSIKAIAQVVADQFLPRPQIMLNCALAGVSLKTSYIPDLAGVRQALDVRTYTSLEQSVASTKEWIEAIS